MTKDIGDNVTIGPNSNIIARSIIIGDNVTVGPNTHIKSDRVFIGSDTKIDGNLTVDCDSHFAVGNCSWISNDVSITCTGFDIGEYAVIFDRAEVGRGGCKGPNSTVFAGDGVMICEDVVINPSERVVIGNNVGIGAGVGIWTHGGYLDTTLGYPVVFAPVTIGNDVWLTGKSTVLPGVTIGNDVVIGMMSLVNEDLPNGCLAGGIPAKVLKENVYPQILSDDKLYTMVLQMVKSWRELIEYKTGVDYSKKVTVLQPHINDLNEVRVLYHPSDDVVSKFIIHRGRSKYIEGDELDEVGEDLRDFLRRNGIKFFTGKPFRSIKKIPPVAHARREVHIVGSYEII